MKKKLLAILCVAVLLVSLGSYAVLGAEPDEGEQDNMPVSTDVPEGVGASLTDSTTIVEDATTSVSMVEDETEDGNEDEDGSSLPAFVYDVQPTSAEEVQEAWDAFVNDGTALPCWEEEIDAEWIPEGAMLVMLVDEETGAEYWTLAEGAVMALGLLSAGDSITELIAAINGGTDSITLTSDFVTDFATLSTTVNLPALAAGRTVTIDGAGLTLAGIGNKHFSVASGNLGTYVIKNLTLDGMKSGAKSGGGFSVNGTVEFENVTVSNNAGTAMPIYEGSTFRATQSSFVGNTNGNSAACINYMGNNITVDLKLCVFKENTVTTQNARGGAINCQHQAGAKLIIDQCVFDGNASTQSGNRSDGGAIALWCNGADLSPAISYKISNSTFVNNKSGDDAAAILIEGSSTSSATTIAGSIDNCTFAFNSTLTSPDGGNGGAIQVFASATLDLTNCTFYKNSKGNGGGGAVGTGSSSASYVGGKVYQANVLYVGNTAGASESNTANMIFASITNRGGIVSLTTANAAQAFGIAAPQLADNGADITAGAEGNTARVQTLWIAPKMVTTASTNYPDGIGTSNPTGLTVSSTDQRGLSRPAYTGTNPDAGAVDIASALFDSNTDGVWDASDAASYSYANRILYNVYTTDATLVGVVAADAATTVTAPGVGTTLTHNGALTLLGWDKDKTKTENPTYLPTDAVPADGSTYYAIWGTAPVVVTYTVTYDWNYVGSPGTYTTQTGITAGSTTTAPTAPTRSGYTFGGWFKEAACTNGWNFGSDAVNGNITLYAKWTQNTVPPTSTPDPTPSSSTPSSSSSRPSSSTAPIISTPDPVSSSSAVPAPISSISEAPVSSSQGLTDIETEGPPLIGRDGSHWALANLIAAIVSLGGGAVALIAGARRKKDNGEEETHQVEQREEEGRKAGNRLWPGLGAVSGVASPIVFFLTENMRLPMAIFDKWTPVMVAILLAQGIFAVLQWNTKRKKDDDAEYAS